MKRIALTVTACVLAAGATAVPAAAAPIMSGSSIDMAGYFSATGGTSLGTATSIDFVNGPGGTASPGIPGTLTSYGSGTGTFAGFTCDGGSCGSINDLLNFMSGPQSIMNFFTLTGGNNTSPINFNLTSIGNINRSDPNFLSFTAFGNIQYGNYDATPASFLFSAQGNTMTSFSATALAAAVPEPGAWAMMILGFGLAGVALRTRRSKVAFAIA